MAWSFTARLLTTAAALAGAAWGYAVPQACSGVCTNAHDPTIVLRGDGTYFRLSTGGKIAVHSAPSIRGPWAYVGPALPGGSSINKAGRDDLWAPEVVKRGNEYFMYYSVSTPGSQDSAIGVATSTDLVSWRDHGSTGVESARGAAYNAIDPHVLKTADGAFVMTFGSWWQDLHTVPMQNPPHRVAAGAAPRQVAFDPKTTAVEGAFVFPWGAYFYLFYSKGACCGFDKNRPPPGAEYKIMVCRSSSPTGGFVDRNGVDCTRGGGTVVYESFQFVYGPGGQGVFNDPVEGPILYYHFVDIRIGFADGQKRFGWNRIDFSSGWPVV
ncbi:glycoside hydrolase family 43 protein [Apiospora kogelbergensis]|uniref:Arabinan endo-1,5-alpha-L-arabinosidase n=1 Tax=Apiospora kogelbergensis TaxID=1337665 RepID=A0AAW0QMW4_9PEZI